MLRYSAQVGSWMVLVRFLDYTRLDTSTHTHTRLDSCERVLNLSQGRYLHNTQQTHDKDIHLLSGIRTRYPRNQAAAGLRLRPHGNIDRQYHSPLDLMAKLNPLKPELNPICYLLALLAHHFFHVSRIRVKSLTIRLLMSYIYGAPILDVSRSHTTTQHSR